MGNGKTLFDLFDSTIEKTFHLKRNKRQWILTEKKKVLNCRLLLQTDIRWDSRWTRQTRHRPKILCLLSRAIPLNIS